jgi:4-diphosphocytidyl-2-C-methyl-D-erythritol kinase
MSSAIWPAPAKLNLMLHITGRREDGYHELQTIFQFIDFGDELKFLPRADDRIVRYCNDFAIPENEDIIIRAATLLRDEYRQRYPAARKNLGVDITLTKNIPMGAGLGGGSSDAATTLVALNDLWQLSFSFDDLAEIGLRLGADVPVFVHGFAAFAEGVGEKLSPIAPQEKWYVVLIPPVHVSTKEIFCNPQLTRDCSAIKLCDLSLHELRNVCTPVVVELYPEVRQAIEIINDYSVASMSGTGASVFAGFDTHDQANDVLQKIKQNPVSGLWFSFVAKGLNQSPLHHMLKGSE